jgi:gas vesicle protein
MERSEEQVGAAELELDEDHALGSAGSFVAGILLGAVIGAGIAVLFAPAAGERTRRQLGRRMRDLRARAEEGLDDATRRARKDLIKRRRRLRARLDRLAAEARDTLADAR